jgi:8-oxo-dGTP pyrophosphatase MutT (NUDIX family)
MKLKNTGAGIICYFDNTEGIVKDLEKEILFLVLETHRGRYDIPKGCIDFGEYVFDCALRETYEECNLKSSDFNKFLVSSEDMAFKCGKGLILFIGEIHVNSIANIKINKNPHTNIFEHSKFLLLPKEKITKKLLSFLNESIEWSYNIIISDRNR